MAAGLSDHVWSLEEIIQAADMLAAPKSSKRGLQKEKFKLRHYPRKGSGMFQNSPTTLGNEFVANAMDGSEVNGTRHLRLKFLP